MREVVETITHGNVNLEIYAVVKNGLIFYDYRFNRKIYKAPDKDERSPFLQERDIRDTVRCLMDFSEFIYQERKGNRKK